MDPQEFLAAVEADHETELSRLGSSKALYAVTAGEMDTPAVLAAMAARASAAADVFEAWAADEPDERAAEAFATAAERQREAAASVDDADGAAAGVPEPGPLFETLASLEGTVERAAGLSAWALVADALYGQAVGFFVGSADVGTADRFRGLRDEVGPVRDDALDLLGATVETDADRERAADAAAAGVEAAYDGYVSVLEDLGITVKPIC